MSSRPPTVQLKEEDIRPQALIGEQQRRFANDVARLLGSRASFVEVHCPACGGSRSSLAWVKYELNYLTCQECNTIYISPRPPPAVLEDYYRHSENYAYWNDVIFPASESARREKLFRPRAERVVEICKRRGVESGTLLEIGAGFGTFGEEVSRLQSFSRYLAVEPTPRLAATCRSRGLEVLEAPIEQVSLGEGSIDAIACFEVVEHLFCPRDIIVKAHHLLRPGGLMIVSVPNCGGFDIMLLKDKSSSVDSEHLNYFNPASLALLFEAIGFDILEVLTPGKLDAELVRSKVLSGEFSVAADPFLQAVLIDRWDELGGPFQEFLAQHHLSSHLWLVAMKASR